MNYNLPELQDIPEDQLPSEFKSPVPTGVKWGRIEELEQTIYLLRHWRNFDEVRRNEKLKELEIENKTLIDVLKTYPVGQDDGSWYKKREEALQNHKETK